MNLTYQVDGLHALNVYMYLFLKCLFMTNVIDKNLLQPPKRFFGVH